MLSGASRPASRCARRPARFSRLGASSLILTKLDEAAAARSAPGLAGRPAELPLCYTTHGQNVPDDIRPAGGWPAGR